MLDLVLPKAILSSLYQVPPKIRVLVVVDSTETRRKGCHFYFIFFFGFFLFHTNGYLAVGSPQA